MRLWTMRRVVLFGCLTVALLAGCAAAPPNTRIDRVDVTRGYRLNSRLVRPNNDSKTLLLLAFSGGGTRAAALSYGVLEALRQTEVDGPRGRRSMLDEVDAISSVSGEASRRWRTPCMGNGSSRNSPSGSSIAMWRARSSCGPCSTR